MRKEAEAVVANAAAAARAEVPARSWWVWTARSPHRPPLEFAFDEAELRGVPLHAVHAWRLPSLPPPADIRFDAAEIESAEHQQAREWVSPRQERHPGCRWSTSWCQVRPRTPWSTPGAARARWWSDPGAGAASPGCCSAR